MNGQTNQDPRQQFDQNITDKLAMFGERMATMETMMLQTGIMLKGIKDDLHSITESMIKGDKEIAQAASLKDQELELRMALIEKENLNIRVELQIYKDRIKTARGIISWLGVTLGGVIVFVASHWSGFKDLIK
jgi:hypothetical protein